MNEPAIVGLTVLLLSVLVFGFSPRRVRHWSVLGFVFTVFLIVLVKLPIKLLFFFIAAVGIWFWSVYADRNK